MNRTGYLILVYQDFNPYSPTYGQERTERQLDTEECKTSQSANYVHVYSYCEMDAFGAYTGYQIKVYEDVEPLSPTYGTQIEERIENTVDCPSDEIAPQWEQVGPAYCEQIAYQPSGRMGNSGYLIIEYRDVNTLSPTYGTTRTEKTYNASGCPVPNTKPVYVVSSEVCNLVEDPYGNMVNDGTKTVVRVDTNEYSSTYNFGEPETVVLEDLDLCPVTSTSPEWVETSYTCVLDDGYRTGYVEVTEEDVNENSSTYGQTRTRTYQDLERCPYQPKPQPVRLKFRVINNRSASTDTITHITMHFNDNYDIDVVGSGIAPAGGRQQGTVLLPYSLKSTGLVLASVELSPNTSMPTQFQTQQTPSPFVWDDSSGSAVLTVTLWDGDGTGPMWHEVSYTCELVSGYRTGRTIIVEADINPDSPTYEQTRTRIVDNDPRCTAQTEADWVETSYSCEQVNGFNTGRSISVQEDMNPNSQTYGTTKNVYIDNDERCPISTSPGWVEISYYCQQTDGFDNGNTVITQEDMNPNSRTYGQTRQFVSTNDPRCVQDTNPSWTEESYVCEQE